MRVEWINRKKNTGAITIYNNNITLNKVAADYFTDAYGALVGIDKDESMLVIKYVSLEDINLKHINKKSIHPVQIKASYGRITGKALIDELVDFFGFDFSNQSIYKFSAKWNVVEKELYIYIEGSDKVD